MSTSTPVRITPSPPARRSPARRWAALVTLAALALAAAGITLTRHDGTSPSPGASGSPSASPSAGPSAVAPLSPAPFSSPSVSSPASTAFRFQPLWPFASVTDAAAWQREAAPNGSQPWRLDPAATALTFASTHLGYAEMNRVTSRQIVGDEAWIGVAGSPPEGRTMSAGVLHLARIGVGPTAERPWEVVGSRDTTLTLTTPRYGSVVGTTVTIGGQITGVDESLVVQIRDRGGKLLARVQGIPAGGEKTPWQVTLTVPRGSSGLVTVAVSTGGHIADVERFAITAATIRPGTVVPATYPTAEAALAAATVDGTYQG